MPTWVQQGYQEYARRMPAGCTLKLVEVSAPARSKTTFVPRLVQQEGELVLKAISKTGYMVALDLKGKMHSSESLAKLIERVKASGKDLYFVVGGADGLSTEVLTRADELWSLSYLTFPHPLVRVILAEQLFRAVGILSNHPYHRP